MRDSDPPARAHGLGDTHGANESRGPSDPRGGSVSRDSDSTARMLSPSRYLAWLYSPEAQQPVLAKLCEIESEIAGSLRPGIDHHVAHARLQWWQEECERCAQGRPVHPLTRDLVKEYGAAATQQPSPLAGLSGFVDTAVWDLAGATFETRKELAAYCERWAAAMFETAAAQVVLRWRVLGAAVREIELLADLAREAHAGRVRIPLDELDRAGLEVSSVAKPPWPGPLVTLLRERHEALRATVRESIAALGREEQARFRGLLVWAALSWQQSARAQRALPGIILPRRYHALADGWLAWRAARRSAAGKLKLG
jgi:phytoene synthase